MNVKVVLLPDGEDPDSFARKHNASQFSEFIKQSETDFIRFKTRLLLDDAGTDPIKRSSLITDIIRTVAIIPDNIARSIYIRECSAMMEIDEQVLLNEVNKIRLSKEERQNMQGQATPPVSNTMSMIPESPDLPGYQPVAGDSFLPPDDTVPLPDDNMPLLHLRWKNIRWKKPGLWRFRLPIIRQLNRHRRFNRYSRYKHFSRNVRLTKCTN